ncbi:MAG: hypothetical protein ACH255_20190, partial [Candidatus Thiodiazotropha sp.]
LEILYNPRLLTFTDSNMTRTTQQGTKIEAESDKGLIRINMAMPVNGHEEGQIQLIKLYLSALKPGTSYLVYRSTRLTKQDGTSVAPQLQTARVNVK